VSLRVRSLALGLLLWPLAAPGEDLLDRLGLQESEIGRALPSPVQEPAERVVKRAEEASAPSGGGPFSLGNFDRNAPVVIRADELEATESSGERALVFRRHVEVTQATMRLRANQLSAVYPQGSKQPSRLEAEGDVVVVEGRREARCDRAVYDRTVRRLDCIGAASLRDGEDRLSGTAIGFDLARHSVQAGGGTELWFEPPEAQAGSEPSAPEAAPNSGALPIVGVPWLRAGKPARIRSLHLEASEDEQGRRVAFDGGVEVTQDDVMLRADRLEAVYPPGADQPERLIATGGVSMLEGTREASCARAEFLRSENRVRCHTAIARAGDDRLEGELIDFTIGEESLSVRGSTKLLLAPRAPVASATP
jgi:lipopolysaccharide transport protein LptA